MNFKSIDRLVTAVLLGTLLSFSSIGFAFGESSAVDLKKYSEQVALISYQKGDLDEALRLLDKAIAMQPEELIARLAKAKMLMSKKDYKNAIEELDFAISKQSEDDRLFAIRAEACAADNQKEKALEDLKQMKAICTKKKDVGGETIADVKVERLITEVPSDTKIVWRKDIASLIEGKEKAPKPLLVDVYTDWCGWCKVMDEKTYSDPFVAKYLMENFICIKLNADDSGEGEGFAASMQVDGYPCTCLLDIDSTTNKHFRICGA